MAHPLKTFIIYARADAKFKNELTQHLHPLVKKNLIEKWDDTHLLPGEEWEKRILQELAASDLVIMLVSADSLYSEFIQKKELKTALEQRHAGITRVIPILVRDCVWEEEEDLAMLQMLPKAPNGHVLPVAAWGDAASAWAAACRELIKLVTDIRAKIAALAEKEAEAEQAAAAERAALEEAAAAAEIARQEADAEKEKKRLKRLAQQDEAAWKTTLTEAAATDDVAEKMVVFQAYLDKDTHTIYREEAEMQISELEARQAQRLRIAAKKAEDARQIAEKEAARLAAIEAEKRKKEEEAARLAAIEAEKRRKEEEAARLAAIEVEKRRKETEAARLAAIEVEKRRKEAEVPRLAAIEDEKRRLKNGHTLRDAPNLPEMVFVEGGTFQMERQVTLSDYLIGKYPVTFEEYDIFCTETKREKPADQGWGRGNRPVINVSHYDAQAYCAWIAQKTSKKYRLPTEAEWELAARGGTVSKRFTFSGSNDLEEVGWFWKNSGDKKLSGDWKLEIITANNCKTHPVGTKKANELGIYDMSGNVWEWCSDWYAAYPSESQSNPTGPDTGGARVYRGGSWYGGAEYCLAALRSYSGSTSRGSNIGFRLARSFPLVS